MRTISQSALIQRDRGLSVLPDQLRLVAITTMTIPMVLGLMMTMIVHCRSRLHTVKTLLLKRYRAGRTTVLPLRHNGEALMRLHRDGNNHLLALLSPDEVRV